MKIYLATPVNGRKEKTLHEKMKAALANIQAMAKIVIKAYPDAEFMSSFEIPDIRALVNNHPVALPSEARIMGECVCMVMEADMIVLDDGWECSQGCTVERFVAMQYGKQVKTINSFKLNEVLKEIYKKAEEQLKTK
jgi:nucleoside 2-deoxyribosyltransferase